ncbi:MAG: type II toxin-antitoxin system RelB/DinJ family antitoxin [Streptococcaceae bacterium]|jgi:DNA-damage-inducible protein J|nr:type II toxin-antitoxin system RelB/DinJ family antitoxin [Streptococcaceae bacterium]
MATITVRLDEELKEESKIILENVGLDMSTAVKMFLKQVVINQGIPFEVVLAKPTIEMALEDVKAGRVKEFSSYEELIKELHDEDVIKE